VPIAKFIWLLVRVQISLENVRVVNCSASALFVAMNQFFLKRKRFGIMKMRYPVISVVNVEFAMIVTLKKEPIVGLVNIVSSEKIEKQPRKKRKCRWREYLTKRLLI
jgi:hypothetical protein